MPLGCKAIGFQFIIAINITFYSLLMHNNPMVGLYKDVWFTSFTFLNHSSQQHAIVEWLLATIFFF